MSILTFLARRFIAGEKIEDAVRVIKNLNQNGMTATLDILGENVKSEQEATRKADNYIQALETIDREKLSSHASLKLTQMDVDEIVLLRDGGDEALDHVFGLRMALT